MLVSGGGAGNSNSCLSLASTLNSSRNSSNSCHKQLENNMNSELKPPPAAAKLLQLNVTSEEQQPEQQQEQGEGPGEGLAVQPLTAEESQLLLQRLSINNPFYRFRKQSNSLKELRRLRRRRRRYRSETDLARHDAPLQTQAHPTTLNQHNEAKVVVVLDSKQHVALSNPPASISSKTRSISSRSLTPPDNSTVITNPFSIFHDDEILTLGVNPRLRSATRPQRNSSSASRGLRRLFEASTGSSGGGGAGSSPANPHYLHRFERQDFTPETACTGSGKPKRSSRAIFKQLSLRKLHSKTEELQQGQGQGQGQGQPPPTLPKLKLSYRYPNRTQSIQSMRAAGSGGYDIQHTAYRPRLVSTTPKSNYFERLQAKTRQGIQKIRDKCRNFKSAQSGDTSCGSEFSGFHTLAKDESFRFISDRAHISNYESRCAAAHAAGKQATIYKSYKSEIDLSKNLHYLEHYLEQNFEQQQQQEQQQQTVLQSAHSVGRAAGQRHRRSLSQAAGNNYENLGTLPICASRRRQTQSDSLSSSDYASVFSGAEGKGETEREQQQQQQQQEREQEQDAMLKLRYEHPDKMCEYYFDNLSSYALGLEQSEDLLLAESAKSARFFYDDDDDDDDEEEEEEEEEGQQAGEQEVDLNGVRLSTNEPDYMARDIRIRVNVNEFEHADWQQGRRRLGRQRGAGAVAVGGKEPARSRYNENLAESTFYQSLNQHLQRQAIAADGPPQQQQQQREKVKERQEEVEEQLAAPLGGGESYLAHFQRSFERLGHVERAERAERAQQQQQQQQQQRERERELFARGEYYGFGCETAEPAYATKQTHYVRSRAATAAAAATTSQQQRCFLPGGNQSLRTAAAATATDALYATSSKQQQQQQQQLLLPPCDALPTTIAAATAATAAAATAAATGPATPVAGNLSAGNASANNRYMLENLRKYYANQQQHPPAHSVNSSSLSNSSSSNSSMSQQQKQLQLPTVPQQQQQHQHHHHHQQQQHHHQSHMAKQQLQHLGARRNSSTSNASSTADNFDNFIALRNATAAGAAASTPSSAVAAAAGVDYMSKRRSQQQQQHQQQHQQHATASGGTLISALNYYGHGLPSGNSSSISNSNNSSNISSSHSNSNSSNSAAGNNSTSSSSILTYNGKLSATAMLSQVNLGRAAALQQQLAAATPTASAASVSASASASIATPPSASIGASLGSEHESFILEYEC